MPQMTEYSASAGIYPSAPKPVIHNATSSCARLCPNAPQTPMKTGVNFVFFPQYAHDERAQKSAAKAHQPGGNTARQKRKQTLDCRNKQRRGQADSAGGEHGDKFESPAFAPGGMPGSGGRRFSRIPSTSASAPNSPMSAMCSAFFFMDVLSILRCFFLKARVGSPFQGTP